MIVLAGIFLPIVAGLLIPALKLNSRTRSVYVVVSSLASSVLAFYIAFASGFTTFTLLNLNRIFSIGFKIDGLSKIFLLIIATLWPIATLYATEYMEPEDNQDSFFRYYLIAYGIALGIGYSINLITLYLFYELLTFLTLPLIMHKIDEKKSLYAGKVYLVVSIFGASLALIGITIFTTFSQNIDFVYGGVLNVLNIDNTYILNIAYLLFFIGFGVKVAMILSIVTILYGSIMAVKERHIKRRLAYSHLYIYSA